LLGFSGDNMTKLFSECINIVSIKGKTATDIFLDGGMWFLRIIQTVLSLTVAIAIVFVVKERKKVKAEGKACAKLNNVEYDLMGKLEDKYMLFMEKIEERRFIDFAKIKRRIKNVEVITVIAKLLNFLVVINIFYFFSKCAYYSSANFVYNPLTDTESIIYDTNSIPGIMWITKEMWGGLCICLLLVVNKFIDTKNYILVAIIYACIPYITKNITYHAFSIYSYIYGYDIFLPYNSFMLIQNIVLVVYVIIVILNCLIEITKYRKKWTY